MGLLLKLLLYIKRFKKQKKSVTESIGFAEMCDWNRGVNVFILEAKGASSVVNSWRREKSFVFSTSALACKETSSLGEQTTVCERSENLFIKCMKEPVKTSIKLFLGSFNFFK